MWALDGPRFFRLAWRLPFYHGVLRAKAMAAAGPTQAPAPGRPSGNEVVPERIDQASVAVDPMLSDLISFG